MISLLIFAHTPPPLHGQSVMVARLLEEMRARPTQVRVFHVNHRVSDSLEDIGRAGAGKVLRTFWHCFQAIGLRLRHGPMIFYYVPAPPKRGALLRDWLVMGLCRPFFRNRLVFHWHAAGLGKWLEQRAGFLAAWVTRRLLGGVDLSIVLSEAVIDDAEALRPKKIRILPNAIPDPCADFDAAVLPARIARAEAGEGIFRVLFMAHCIREKGLYDALEGVFDAQKRLCDEGSSVRLALTVAGQFMRPEERSDFMAAVARLRAEWPGEGPAPGVEYAGFITGHAKDRLLRDSDCFCFPTYYRNEIMPVSLIEALAYGMPIVTTRWRAIPGMLPAAGCFLVPAHEPGQVGDALRQAVRSGEFSTLREHYLRNFGCEVFGQRFYDAIAGCLEPGE